MKKQAQEELFRCVVRSAEKVRQLALSVDSEVLASLTALLLSRSPFIQFSRIWSRFCKLQREEKKAACVCVIHGRYKKNLLSIVKTVCHKHRFSHDSIFCFAKVFD